MTEPGGHGTHLHAEAGGVAFHHAQHVTINQRSPAGARRFISPQVNGFAKVVGRDDELAVLRDAFTDTDEPIVRVLTGLGGVGKSSIARAYAQRHKQEYAIVGWIRCEDRESVPGEFRALLPPEAAQVPDPVQAVHALLANDSRPWLLVLDNVVDADQLRELLPAAGTGYVIATSRAGSWPDDNLIVRVKPLAEPAAVELLTSVSRDADAETAAVLAGELGGLSLALAQAASYVRQGLGMTLAEYLELYRAQRPKMHRVGKAPDYSQTVATTWSLAFEKISPEARELLNLLCWYAPDSIPLGALLKDAVTRNEVVEDLESFSLITRADNAGAVNMHRLVQAVTIDQLTDRAEWITKARDLLRAISPVGHATAETLTTWSAVEPHLRALLVHLPPEGRTTLAMRLILARWTGEAGRLTAARHQVAALVVDYQRIFGPNFDGTLLARIDLANWTGRAGDPAGARDQCRDLLTDLARILGPDHPNTLATRSNLALWTGRAGNPEAARDQYLALLDTQLRVLGPNHAQALLTRHNLAVQTGEAGDPAGARDQLAELLDDQLRYQGRNSPRTLTTRGELARWTSAAGDPAGAREQSEALLADCLRVLGPDHPDSLLTRHNLAVWTDSAGDPQAARDQYAALLADCLRILGPDHPQTQLTRKNLDRLLRSGDKTTDQPPDGRPA